MADKYVKCVHLSNGDAFKIFTDAYGTMYYFDKEGTKKKVRKNQKVIEVQQDVVQGASGEYKFATDTQLFRVSLPLSQDIWDANKGYDKYTGFSQNETENITFEGLTKVVKDYEYFEKERAISVERDHIVEIQMVSGAWDRVNNGKQPNTRATLRCIRDSVNHLDNLNCTPGAVNMKKKSGVMRFLRDYESGDGNGLRQNLLDCGVGQNTTRRICTTFEEASHKVADKVQKEGRAVYDDFADEITSMIGHINLD